MTAAAAVVAVQYRRAERWLNVYNVCNSRLKPMTGRGGKGDTHALVWISIHIRNHPACLQFGVYSFSPFHHRRRRFFPLRYRATWKLRDPRSGKIQNLVARIHTHTRTHTHVHINTHMLQLTRARRRRKRVAAGNSKLKKARKGRRNQRADWISNGEKELRIKKKENAYTLTHTHTHAYRHTLEWAESVSERARARPRVCVQADCV